MTKVMDNYDGLWKLSKYDLVSLIKEKDKRIAKLVEAVAGTIDEDELERQLNRKDKVISELHEQLEFYRRKAS